MLTFLQLFLSMVSLLDTHATSFFLQDCPFLYPTDYGAKILFLHALAFITQKCVSVCSYQVNLETYATFSKREKKISDMLLEETLFQK